MNRAGAVIEELLNAGRTRRPSVLATVVRTLGSVYLGVGARMVVHADGTAVGMVSGGCLEADIASRVPELLAAGRAETVLYDARSPDDLVWGLGLGCEGLVEILLEPLMPDDAELLGAFLKRSLDAADDSVIATVYRAPIAYGMPAVGARAALAPPGAVRTFGGWGARIAPDVIASNDGAVAIAFEVICRPVHLVICGAGPDASSVARLAHDAGWRCTVVGHSDSDARDLSAQFPQATLIEAANGEAVRRIIAAERRPAAIVMSHRYDRDLKYLRVLLETDATYIGVLGPKRRTERMLAELSASVRPAAGALGRVFGPAGLDIGGEGPEAVALSIIAEITAVMNGRKGGHLRERTSPIHDAREVPVYRPSAAARSAL